MKDLKSIYSKLFKVLKLVSVHNKESTFLWITDSRFVIYQSLTFIVEVNFVQSKYLTDSTFQIVHEKKLYITKQEGNVDPALKTDFYTFLRIFSTQMNVS